MLASVAPPPSLNKEQEQEYRLAGNQIHHSFEHPVAKYNKAMGNVRERAVFRLVLKLGRRGTAVKVNRAMNQDWAAER